MYEKIDFNTVGLSDIIIGGHLQRTARDAPMINEGLFLPEG